MFTLQIQYLKSNEIVFISANQFRDLERKLDSQNIYIDDVWNVRSFEGEPNPIVGKVCNVDDYENWLEELFRTDPNFYK